MQIDEIVQRRVRELPTKLQAEVLDFVEYLASRESSESVVHDGNWSELSLSWALRGMENEEGPNYALSDLKEVFS